MRKWWEHYCPKYWSEYNATVCTSSSINWWLWSRPTGIYYRSVIPPNNCTIVHYFHTEKMTDDSQVILKDD